MRVAYAPAGASQFTPETVQTDRVPFSGPRSSFPAGAQLRPALMSSPADRERFSKLRHDQAMHHCFRSDDLMSGRRAAFSKFSHLQPICHPFLKLLIRS
jgi:hypothetical protein